MSNNNIYNNFYSRQIGTYGLGTQEKIMKMNIFIYGMRGIGIETAKNIVLAGPKSLTIFDPNPARIRDLTSNYFLTEENVKMNQRRDESSIQNLSELNPYVKLNIMENNDIIQDIKKKLKEPELKYDVVIITEFLSKKSIIEIDELCRNENIGFILALELGIYGFIFVDFGNNFTIFDETGDEIKEYLIKNISKEKNGKVTINTELSGNIKLTSNDLISFKEIQGMTELNDCPPMKIKIKGKNEIEIGDTSNFSDYIGGGILYNIKQQKKMKFESFKERVEEPIKEGEKYYGPLDVSNPNIQEILRIGLLSLFDFFDKKGNLPEINNTEDENELYIIAQNILKQKEKKEIYWVKNIRNNIESYNAKFDFIFEQTIKRLSNWAKTEICPISSFLGGLTAQESIKYSGKYKPIHQWLYSDFSQIVDCLNVDKNDKKMINSRYDDQIAIFGNNIQKKLSETNIFMIGAGALGCEFLKTFSAMGIATNENKRVFVTDNDNIELSNLNRQFLFNINSIGKPKAEIACNSIKKMNKNFNCDHFQVRLGPESENIFDEEFWNKQDFIINAVDNIRARKYIAEQSLIYKKILIDSGTHGTKANCQIIVPHKTIPYSPPENKQNDFMNCTPTPYPFNINHCITWAKDKFKGYFVNTLEDVKMFLNDRNNFYKKFEYTPFEEKIEKLKKIFEYSKIVIEKNFEKCVEEGLKQYNINFRNEILDSLENNKNKKNFWIGERRLPHPITFNIENKDSLLFVKKFAQILSRALSIPIIDDDKKIIEIISRIKIEEYFPKPLTISTQVYNNRKEEIKAKREQMKLINKKVENYIKEEINPYFNSLEKNINCDNLIKIEEFDKDDDSKGHIEFLYAFTNLRAENYDIKKCDISKVKITAGNIIPSIASTTAAIVGIVAMQLYVLKITENIKYLRNCYCLNFANNAIYFENVRQVDYVKDGNNKLGIDKQKYKLIPEKYTIWDYLIINGSFTIKQFIDYIKQKYNVNVTSVSSDKKEDNDKGDKNLEDEKKYILFSKNKSEDDKLNKKIEEVYINLSGNKLYENKKFLMLEIEGDIDNCIAKMPKFKYNFKE